MNEPKDKRTKAYKEWKALQPTEAKKGLGDVVETITKATGIKKAVKFIKGDDCGCKERKEKLNKIKLPVRRKAQRCFNEDQYNQFKEYRTRRTLKSWSREDTQLLIDLYAHVFAIQYNPKSICSNCVGAGKILFQLDKDLEIVYNSYK